MVKKIRKLRLIENDTNRLDLETNLYLSKPCFGNTIDGNTARSFFANPEVSSNIKGIDKTLIERFSVILKLLF